MVRTLQLWVAFGLGFMLFVPSLSMAAWAFVATVGTSEFVLVFSLMVLPSLGVASVGVLILFFSFRELRKGE